MLVLMAADSSSRSADDAITMHGMPQMSVLALRSPVRTALDFELLWIFVADSVRQKSKYGSDCSFGFRLTVDLLQCFSQSFAVGC